MKTNLWKRAAVLLLALVLCFACVGTASAAEDVSGKVYLISYCKSAFEKTTVDYLENQAILTMLKKEKIVDGSGTLLFQHPNYIERSGS